ncbi:UNVERIFIED_CONTAM: Pentatricopeptide repeat-containing protein MRL1, chloroplastic [Sesamum radiatum]|uniref:Pentatricopeptide repeat-containing protein MRL1, chloroplastic n=1 Tax=Sesamum radiatum TaxID=300843 RepID=A0AAW2RV18_SESRA
MVNAGVEPNVHTYGALIDGCAKAGQVAKAFGAYGILRSKNVKPDRVVFNALITACGQSGAVDRAFDVLAEMRAELQPIDPDHVTIGALMKACASADQARDWQKAVELYEGIKSLNLKPTVSMMNALITALSMCLQRFQAACAFGEPVLSFTFGQVQLNSKWTSLALMVYRETIVAGAAPTKDELSQVLGCLQLPHDVSVRNRLIENLGLNTDTSKGANLLSLIDGFGEYDPRAFSLLEVYFLTVLKGLKHRLAAGAKLPNVQILLPIEKAQIQTSAGEKMINVASSACRLYGGPEAFRGGFHEYELCKGPTKFLFTWASYGRIQTISQAVAALLRRLGLSYQGNESYGKIRINGVIIRKWFQPKLGSPYREKKIDLSSSIRHLGSGIRRQQRKIRTVHLSLE